MGYYVALFIVLVLASIGAGVWFYMKQRAQNKLTRDDVVNTYAVQIVSSFAADPSKKSQCADPTVAKNAAACVVDGFIAMTSLDQAVKTLINGEDPPAMYVDGLKALSATCMAPCTV